MFRLTFCSTVSAKWKWEFEAQHTRDGNTFYPDTDAPEEKKLTLMFQTDSIPYVNLTSQIGAQMINVPFKNADFTFTIILPNKGVKLAQVESRLTPALLNSPTHKGQKRCSVATKMEIRI